MLAKDREFIARFAARASHAAQVQSRVKKLEKIEIIEIPEEQKAVRFEWQETPRGGEQVLLVNNLAKTWKTEQGEKKVFSGANATVKRLDRIAVVGVNGAGKSTLMKIIVGATEATQGEAKLGPSIELGYFSQNSLDILNPENTIIQEMQAHLPVASLVILEIF